MNISPDAMCILDDVMGRTFEQIKNTKYSKHTKSTLIQGKKSLEYCRELREKMDKYMRKLESATSELSDFVGRVRDDLSKPHPDDDFVFSTAHGMLSYRGRDKITHEKKTPHITTRKKIKSRILIPECGYYINVNTVNSLSDIQPAICYFDGEDKGFYCCLVPGVYVKIPFPEIIDATKNFSRMRTIRCKHITLKNCDDKRKEHCKTFAQCNFAHKGQRIKKLGYSSRCPSLPVFGHPSRITTDVKKIKESDIKNVMLYGLSDLMAAMIWMDSNKIKKKVITDIDIA